MKNKVKILKALEQTYPFVDISFISDPHNDDNINIYIDGLFAASFKKYFWETDFDENEIEIKIKASKEKLNDFASTETLYTGYMRKIIERGLKEWEKE